LARTVFTPTGSTGNVGTGKKLSGLPIYQMLTTADPQSAAPLVPTINFTPPHKLQLGIAHGKPSTFQFPVTQGTDFCAALVEKGLTDYSATLPTEGVNVGLHCSMGIIQRAGD